MEAHIQLLISRDLINYALNDLRLYLALGPSLQIRGPPCCFQTVGPPLHQPHKMDYTTLILNYTSCLYPLTFYTGPKGAYQLGFFTVCD